MKTNGTDFDANKHSSFVNNFLHSLFSQCSVTINGVSITPYEDLYQYRTYFETLLTYGRDAAITSSKLLLLLVYR